MKKFPKVIGLVPTYNAFEFIQDTLEALSLQTYPNFEVIICDDCSSDGTFQLCQDFALAHPNFRVIQNEKNIGWLSNTQKLWELAVGNSDYCYSNPHDDHPYPDFVSRQVEILEANPKAVICIPGLENHYVNGVIIKSNYGLPSEASDPVERVFALAKRKMLYWWACYHGLHRTSTIASVLPMQRLMMGQKEFSADLIWLIKMAMHGEFEMADKLLMRKNYLPLSVSDTWSHNTLNKAGLWLAILSTIQHSSLSYPQKKQLYYLLFKELISKIEKKLSSK